MAAPRKYPEELRERAIRMAVNPETLRSWVTRAEIDAGDRPGTTTAEAQRIAELERENRELDVRDPQLVRSGRGEVPVDQVRAGVRPAAHARTPV